MYGVSLVKGRSRKGERGRNAIILTFGMEWKMMIDDL